MPGQLCSKSNSRQIVTIKGRPALIKNKEARQYVQNFYRLMPKPATPYTGKVMLHAAVYYQDMRRDLDIALIQDCLQVNEKYGWPGIIVNDRQVVEIHAKRFLDKSRPRTWFKLTAVDE